MRCCRTVFDLSPATVSITLNGDVYINIKIRERVHLMENLGASERMAAERPSLFTKKRAPCIRDALFIGRASICDQGSGTEWPPRYAAW